MPDKTIEESLDFTPKFDSNGLIPVIAQDAKTGQVLMFAYMNKEALEQTIQTGYAVYFSRTRKKLWKKGEQSGHFQKVQQILVDCDQDCLVLKVNVDAGQCHTGYQSCFYRAVAPPLSCVPLRLSTQVEAAGESKRGGKKLNLIAKKTFDPKKIY
jgi:phosphoribosyl-AMP cyclohydrolase